MSQNGSIIKEFSYFPRGSWYSIHVPNPDLPFSWLIEEVLKRREDRGEDDPKIVQSKLNRLIRKKIKKDNSVERASFEIDEI